MHIVYPFKYLVAIVLISFLVGCGGGGGGGGDDENDGSNTPSSSSDWDQMIWDRDTWD